MGLLGQLYMKTTFSFIVGIADVRNDEDGEITAKTGVHVQTQQTSGRISWDLKLLDINPFVQWYYLHVWQVDLMSLMLFWEKFSNL